MILAMNAGYLPAQIPSLYFEKLTTQNGLSHNKVNCIIQDQRGFIWIGTDDGLNRYDGHHFVVFRHQPGNPASISGNIITEVVEDKEGVLWIATSDGGLTRYDQRLPPQQQFKQYKHLPGDSTSLPVNVINSLLLDPYGYLWLATSGQGVLRFNKTTGRYEDPVQYGTRTILDLCLDSTGHIWVGRQGGGILKINAKNLEAHTDDRYDQLYAAAALPHSAVTALYTDNKNQVWFGSWDKVLYRQEATSGREDVFQQTASPYSFRNDEINCFAADAQGRLWMGGQSKGLHMYDQRTNRFYNYQYDASREGTIADNRVNSLFADKSGNVWIGTNKGLSIHHTAQEQFAQTFLPVADPKKIITLYDFYKQPNGDLWIGTSEGLYIRRKDSSFVHHPLSYKGIPLSVTKFFTDRAGEFYLGTNYSLFRYDIKNNRLHLLPNTDKDEVMNGIYESRVVSVVEHSIAGKPVLLVSPYGHYLTYYDREQQHWVSRQDTTANILQRFNVRDNLIRKFYPARDGRLWVATAKRGLAVWDQRRTPAMQFFNNNPQDSNTISNNNVFDVAEDAAGNLWVSTFGGGLHYLNTATNKFTHIPVSRNLLEGLQVDRRGLVWMISNGNLHSYDPVQEAYTSYELPDIDKSGGVKGSIHNDNSGRIYVAGNNYFISFDPLSLKEETTFSKVFFTDFRIFNQSFSDLLWKNEIRLNHTQNYFTLEFAAPDFSAARNVRYSYQLEGRDKDWIEIGNRNFEQFSNLSGGHYVLKIRATNRAGNWENQVTSLHITIVPPYWTTWWFYAICAAVLALIVYAIYRYRINEILKRQAIRNKIAQDLHDNMGSTLSSISVYSRVATIYNDQQRQEELQQTLEKISVTSGEMISEMSDIVWAINPRNDDMDTILQRMESFARPLLASQGIAFHFEADPAVKQVNLEMTRRKNFYLIFKEAVNNALKYAECKNLWVRITVRNHQLQLIVQDDGKGFDLEKAAIHASQSLSGNGLRNMEMRAEEMKGIWQVKSEPGKGTKIYLRFPVG